MAFSKIGTRFGSRVRAVAPLQKDDLLKSGRWIDNTQAAYFKITDAERRDTWLSGEPLARANDWLVDHYDKMSAQLVYRRYALAVHKMGWSGFPESRTTRAPVPMIGHFNDRSGPYATRRKTRYFPTFPSERRDALLPFEQVVMESDNSGSYDANLALVMGPASLHTRALDLDITDPVLSEQVYQLAVEHLGPTPFVRVGRAPKMLLVYRVAEADADIPTRSYAFLGADGEVELVGSGLDRKVANAIEFLATGRNFTAYGLHHRTERTFDWSRGTLHPAIAGPDQAPLVSKKQLNAFYEAVNALRPLSNYALPGDSSSPTGNAEVSKFEMMHDTWIPHHFQGQWVMDEQGYVTDGREGFMSTMTWAFMSANINMLRQPDTRNMLRLEVEQWLTSRCVSDDTRSDESIRKEAGLKWKQKLKRWLPSIAEHDRSGKWIAPAIPYRLLEDGSRPFAQRAPRSPRPTDGSMDWLPPQPSVFAELSDNKKLKLIKARQTKEQIAQAKAERALVAELADREAIHVRVAQEIDAAGEAFLQVLAAEREANTLAPLHILKAPTGAGKTTRTVTAIQRFLADYPRTADDGPILFMMPSHDNISEAMGVAERSGMIVPNPSEIDEDEVLEMLREAGVKAAVMSGKKHHCLRLGDLQKLTSAGIGTAGLCGTELEEGGNEMLAKMKRKAGEKPEMIEVLCEFRDRGECGYWKQMSDIANADIVFLPHSYLTMHQPPAVLKKARAVIVDESIVYRLLHFTELRLDTLLKPRGTPFVTKAEKAAKPDRTAKDLGEDMEQEREHVAEVVMKAFGERRCPAQAVLDAGCEHMIRSAIKVVTRSHSVERDVNPRMSADQIEKFANRPTGLALIEEEKFWRILEDRIADIRNGIARGDSDARFHLFFKTETVVENKKAKRIEVPYVRVSWRSEMNWPDAPMLLLDASASPEIMAKCSGRDVTVHSVEAPLNVRTVALIERPWSNRAFMPPDSAEDWEHELARSTIRKARDLITKTAVAYSHGRVLVGMSITVREVLFHGGWKKPDNIDVVHFGALRGKDGFKHHLAAISIGRSEQPIYVIDGYQAALTFDDVEPEKPYDLLGTGLDKSGAMIFREPKPRRIPFRSGQDVGHLVPVMPGRWAKILESQWREEELRQFLGRLRPVYRGGAPVDGVSDEVPIWICMSSTLPENIIVDELFALDDIVAGSEFHDLVRLSGGVLGEGITGRLANCRPILEGKTIDGWTDEVLQADYKLRRRLLDSMHTVRVTVDGVPTNVRVAAWHSDPLAAVQRAVELANARSFSKLAVEVLSVEMAINGPVTASSPRKPDRVDAAFAELAPFGDTETFLDIRQDKLRKAHGEITAAGKTKSLEEIEQKWRAGTDLDVIVEMAKGEVDRSAWVRMFDGEELFEIEPHYAEAA